MEATRDRTAMSRPGRCRWGGFVPVASYLFPAVPVPTTSSHSVCSQVPTTLIPPIRNILLICGPSEVPDKGMANGLPQTCCSIVHLGSDAMLGKKWSPCRSWCGLRKRLLLHETNRREREEREEKQRERK